VGKSTLALMLLRSLALKGDRVLLIAAEESTSQVALRPIEWGSAANLDVAATIDVHAAEQLLRERRPVLCVIDSISAMSDATLPSVAGSVPQIRHAAERLCSAAKECATALILVGHVTKDGELAGPRTLEHLVDTVVRIEGDRHGTLRFIRAIKHRFGPTGEVGLLEMVSEGLRDLPDAALTCAARAWTCPASFSPSPTTARARCSWRCRRWWRRVPAPLDGWPTRSPRSDCHCCSRSSRRAAALIPAPATSSRPPREDCRERTRRRRGARAGGRVGGVGFRGSEQPGCRGRGGPRGRAARGQRALSPGARSIPFGSHDGHRARGRRARRSARGDGSSLPFPG